MNSAFRMLPLPGKLLLITLLPLLLIIILAFNLYKEKKEKIIMLDGFRSQVRTSQHVMDLSESLQAELKFSFLQLVTGEKTDDLHTQRVRTDSLLQVLFDKADKSIRGFAVYTFLDQLEETRLKLDNGAIQQSPLTSYYINAIYRLHTMSTIGLNQNVAFYEVNKDLVAGKIISQLITYYSILRLNIFNVLHTKSDGVGTLYGLRGVNDMYHSFEKELLTTASPEWLDRFSSVQKLPDVVSNQRYIDGLFNRYDFDSTHNSQSWWIEATSYIEHLKALRVDIKKKVEEGIEEVYTDAKKQQRRTITYVLILIVVTGAIIMYAIRTISKMLHEIRKAARKIAAGVTGVELGRYPSDVMGNLAHSISMLDKSHSALAGAANEIGKGNFSIPVHPRSKKDVLGRAIRKMKADLQQLTEDVKQRQQQITQAVLQGQEKERTRIGEELHDNVNQLLTSAKLYLSVARRNPDGAKEMMVKTDEILALSIEEIRKLSKDLVMPSLRTSLKRSIEELVADILVATDINFTVEVNNLREEELSDDLKVTIYRIVQEQMKNVLKYSQAQSVLIKIDTKINFIDLLIADDGKGFDPQISRKGVGISNIINRVEAYNGHIKIESAPNEGCRIVARMSMSGSSKRIS